MITQYERSLRSYLFQVEHKYGLYAKSGSLIYENLSYLLFVLHNSAFVFYRLGRMKAVLKNKIQICSR